MSFNVDKAIMLVKARKNMMVSHGMNDVYITTRVNAVVKELERKGIHLTDTADDVILVVDITVWQYNNRDNPNGMPEWLKLARRERWLNDKKINDEYKKTQAEVTEIDS